MSAPVERPVEPARGAERVGCPHCSSSEGIACTTSSGRPCGTHKLRFVAMNRAMRHREFVVEIKDSDERLGLLAGEQYVATAYWLDPGKVTLLRRVPDGHSPECNQYWEDVTWLRWDA